MHDAVADEFRMLEPGDHRKDAPLLREAQVGLEADQVVEGTVGVVAPELHNGVVVFPRAGIAQSDGLHRPETHGV